MSPAPRRIWKSALVNVLFLGTLVFVWFEGHGADEASTPSEERAARGVRFVEVSAEVGVDFRHRPTSVDPLVEHIEPQIVATGAAVSVVDVDQDGWPDLYATTSARGGLNALYHNQGDGTFVDVAEEAGLADLNREGSCMGSIWADYDADGQRDVLVYKWGRCQLFRNLGGLRFEDVTERAGLTEWINSNAATWVDFDNDGLLDLYLTGYYSEEHDLWNLETTRIMHDSFEFAVNGGRNLLYKNKGDGTFEDVTEVSGAGSRRWTYGAVAADFDRDGWVDLYLANDYGSEELLLNQEGRGFALAEGLGLDRESKSGMCIALGNLLNDGRLSVFVTNISKQGYLFQGNNLRLSMVDEGGQMMQFAEGAVADCGWAWGAQFGDLDDDGWQDLVVVNGFISASRERDYWYQMSKIGGGTGDLVADARNWPAMEDRSLSGYERTRVLLREKGRRARFAEVGEAVGLSDDFDGRAVALGDLDRDGDLDVVIANQAGPLLVYRNETELGNRWVAFDLVGRRTNRDALGAEVSVEFDAGRQSQVVTSFSGFSAQNEHRLHFGLGADPGPLVVTVRWPGGKTETIGIQEDGLDRAHVLVEGEVKNESEVQDVDRK